MADNGLPRLRARVRSVSDSVKAHPGMYFGAFPAADWPLVIAAWTATDLLRLAEQTSRVELTLHTGGGLSASVRGARVTAPISGDGRPVGDIIRAGMWYTELSRSTVVDVAPPGEPQLTGDELLWSGLDVTIRSELDPGLFGVPAADWWRDGVTRLAAVLATPRHRPADWQRVHVTDEETGETADLP
ncbi:hypothetical protein ABT297_29025 [Dactylosporangium sp. NPDC000555]|uniref:hypothetical protein n=1 Tax=Dactylosporangium sp. NPDC000555 TaxID=3154260 RepID=UPI00332F4410